MKLELQIKKKEEEVRALQTKLKKKKNELKELKLELEAEREKEQAEFNAKVVREMEQRFGKFTEESLEEFLKNLDVGSSVTFGSDADLYPGPVQSL